MKKVDEEIIKIVYNRFIESEYEDIPNTDTVTKWSNMDEILGFIDYLTDYELIKECTAKSILHSDSKVRCNNEHPIENCFAPRILSAVNVILDHYCNDTEELSKEHRYIFCYYMALTELKLIYPEMPLLN